MKERAGTIFLIVFIAIILIIAFAVYFFVNSHHDPSTTSKVNTIKALKKELSSDFIIPDTKLLRIEYRWLAYDSYEHDEIIGYGISGKKGNEEIELMTRIHGNQLRYDTKHEEGVYNYEKNYFTSELIEYKGVEIEVNRVRIKSEQGIDYTIQTYCYFQINDIFYEVYGQTIDARTNMSEGKIASISEVLDHWLLEISKSMIDQKDDIG